MNKKTYTSFIIVGVFAVVAFAVAMVGKKAPTASAVTDNNTSSQPVDTATPVPTVSTSIPSTNSTNISGDDDNSSDDEDDRPTKTPVKVVSTPVADVPKKVSTYKDGTYTASGNYDSPGGMDSIGVTLTLKSGIVTDVSVSPVAGDRTSARYQAKFVSGYKSLVIGKSLDSIKLTVVSGSSLTPIGFNAALDAIKAKAKA